MSKPKTPLFKKYTKKAIRNVEKHRILNNDIKFLISLISTQKGAQQKDFEKNCRKAVGKEKKHQFLKLIFND